MQTFFKHEGAFFYIDLVINEFEVFDDYQLELLEIPIDSSSISAIETYEFYSEKARNDFKAALLSELKKMAAIDDKLSDMITR